MHAQTMEGLVGARSNMELMNTPMRIYREARQRGDTAVMERAMGYACDFAGQAQTYQKKAEEGMEKDAREEKERLKQMQEEAVRKRREERRALEDSAEKSFKERESSGQKTSKAEEEKASGFSPDPAQSSGETADAAGVPVKAGTGLRDGNDTVSVRVDVYV